MDEYIPLKQIAVSDSGERITIVAIDESGMSWSLIVDDALQVSPAGWQRLPIVKEK